ncbi:hypothetical protein HGRIS_005200 [Hohenbuehelia grisea]|uniref:DUF6534 domain-containing protein n=1 Tax=Hohenbuehelia grisea TaxID=104357 RepID=A0ABR3JE94_9AGAR
MACTALGLGAACDVGIAASMCFLLHRSRSGLKATDNIVTTLMVYTVNTGLLTSIWAIADIICFVAMPLNFVNIGINFVVGKLYANSLMASLNSRQTLRSMAATGTTTGTPSIFRLTSVGNTDSDDTRTTLPFAAQIMSTAEGGKDPTKAQKVDS